MNKNANLYHVYKVGNEEELPTTGNVLINIPWSFKEEILANIAKVISERPLCNFTLIMDEILVIKMKKEFPYQNVTITHYGEF